MIFDLLINIDLCALCFQEDEDRMKYFEALKAEEAKQHAEQKDEL